MKLYGKLFHMIFSEAIFFHFSTGAELELVPWSEFRVLLTDKGEGHRLDRIEKPLLEQILIFLEPLYDSCCDFQHKWEPTLNYAILWRDVSHLIANSEEHDAVIEFKRKT